MTRSYSESIQWAIAAAVALAIWLSVVVSMAIATRPRDPDPHPAGLEFAGDEPPAVVNFLTHGWKLRHAAVSATLVDLAARDAVVFDEPFPDRYTVRVVSTPRDLTSYEQQVLALVEDMGRDGTAVPFEALTTGESKDADKWFKRFQKRVIAEARARGLSRDRWTFAHWLAVGVFSLAPALFAAAAFVLLPTSENSNGSEDNGVVGYLVIAGIAWAALVSAFAWIRQERDTDAGLAAAGRWLGLRDNLRAGTFADMEPTAVAIWDRYLAYAVALGVGVTTARAIPLGEESDTEAWSAVGGRWRLVRVTYRSWWPPGWGRPPWSAVSMGLLQVGWVGAIVYAAVWLTDEADTGTDTSWHDAVYSPAGAAVALVLLVIATRGLIMMALGILDLRRSRIIEGRVLRVRTPKDKPARWAVDDGTADEIQALRGATHGGIRQGVLVRAEASPRLGYVRDFDFIGERKAAEIPTPPELIDPALSSRATAVLAQLDAATVGAAVGRAVQAGETKPVPGGAFRPFMGEGIAVTVTFAPDGPGTNLYRQATSLPSMLRRDVPGVGDEAVWLLRHSLAVMSGSGALMVAIRAKHLENDERRSAAVVIADAVLNLDRNTSPA